MNTKSMIIGIWFVWMVIPIFEPWIKYRLHQLEIVSQQSQVNIDSLRQQPEEKGAMLKEIGKRSAVTIKNMVLDGKTNKEIAEATGLKYWEVRDYIQYSGLYKIREEITGIVSKRRKSDGYNMKMSGPNADRHLCRTCIYRGRPTQVGNCNYVMIEGHSRGMPAAECTVYQEGRKRKKTLW